MKRRKSVSEGTGYASVIDRVAARAAAAPAALRPGRRGTSPRPAGRQLASLRSAPPVLLEQLARHLMDDSYAARFEAPARSLELARLAVGCVEIVVESEDVGEEAAADLHAEALGYLGNALRISSDLAGAEEALANAVELAQWGTGRPELKATLLSLLASLRFAQGRPREASRLLDREIALRRRLAARERLGHALIDRGVVAASLEPVETACVYLAEGVARAAEPERILLALQPLAERLARDGDGEQARRVLGVAEGVATLVGGRSHSTRLQWIRGIAARAEGELAAARTLLQRVRETLAEEGSRFRAALVSLDLAAVHAAAGRPGEVRRLAEEAYSIFRAEGLERRALAAFLLFYRAARSERASEELAVRVANLLARRRLSRTQGSSGR
ncbi:MAG: hypothetical protein R3325_14135 [Thermoanaerobaculia bacterium]|nr:hypothetical protein [Thermoanaerobaculia bacterium]